MNISVIKRKPLLELWEFVATVSTTIVFTIVSLGTLIVFGLLLAAPIVVILLIYQYLF